MGTEERCFTVEYSLAFVRAYPLNLAMRTLRPDVCAGLDLIVNTDNAATAHALGTGWATDTTLPACDREIWLLAALGSLTITIRHKPGVNLIFTDTLSRAHSSPTALEFVAKYCVSHNVARIRVTHDTNDILSHSL